MEEKDFDALVDKIGDQAASKIKSEFKELEQKYQAKLDEATKDKASSEELETLKTELQEAKETIKNQAVTMDQLKEMSVMDAKYQKNAAIKAIQTAITEKAAEIKGVANGGVVKLNVKAAGVIGSSNFGSGVLQGLRLAEIERIDRDPFFILGLINVINGGVGSNPLSWIEMQDKEGAPTSVAENAAKPFVDFNWAEGKATAETIAGIVPINKQALNSMPMIENMIRTELIAMLQLELQEQILRGNGASPNLKGITEYAAAFDAGGLAGSIVNAQEKDVLRAMVAQVYRAKGIAKGVTIHPDKAAMLDLTKGTDGHYDLAPFVSADGQLISGARVYQDFGLAADAFLGGDFSKSMFNIVEDITIEVGWINDQFQKNQLSLRAEIFGAHGIKAQHANKFVKGDFATAKAALNIGE